MALTEMSTKLTCIRVLLHNVRAYASQAQKPRITLPHRMVQKMKKMKLKVLSEQHRTKRTYKGPTTISCKHAQFNHHHGQTYSNFNPEFLASKGWKHPKSVGDFFVLNGHRGNPALEIPEGEPASFSEMGINSKLIASLADNGITQPTHIQALTIPHMMSRKTVLCAAETGSGKTLAYLLPIMEYMYRQNCLHGPVEMCNQPCSIIVTPSRELADQIHAVTQSLSASIGYRAQLMVGGRGTQAILRHRPQSPLDLLISTPGILSKLLTNRLFDLSRLQHIILDEADTLMDDSFQELTIRLLNKMKIVGEKIDVASDPQVVGMQLAMVSATLPRSVDEFVAEVTPMETIVQVTTPHLHRVMPHVPQKFLRLGPSKRPEALLKVLESNVKRRVPTLVFCNKSATVKYLGHFLDDNKISNILFTAATSQKVREGRFEKFQQGEFDVMVCTDVASRGLDTIRAKHVINYEFPEFISDYIHRVGRVGRVGSSPGFVLNFVTYKWDVELLWKIEAAARRVTEFFNVNANIKRKLDAVATQRAMQAELGTEQMLGVKTPR